MAKTAKGQSLAEYALVIGIISVVLMVMGPGFRWSAQQVLKSTADAIGFQAGAEQAANPDDGFLNLQQSQSQTTSSSSISDIAGNYTATESETTRVQSKTYSNGAFIHD